MKTLFTFSILILCIFLFSSINTSAQSAERKMNEPNANYYDIVQQMEQTPGALDDTIEGGNRDVYYQWKQFWQNRVGDYNGNPGSFRPAMDAMLEYTKNFNDYCQASGAYTSDWQVSGPEGDDVGQELGLVTAIWVDPTNQSHILLGGSGTGLFETQNNGQNWTCLTDAFIPATGIEAIAVNPNNSDDIYIATSVKGINESGYGIGICFSDDGGQTWQVDEDFISQFFSSYQIPTIHDIDFAPGTSKLYATSGSRIFYKNLSGNNQWSEITPDQNSFPTYNNEMTLNDIEFHPQSSDYAFFTGSSDGHNGGAQVWRLTLSNNSWTEVTPSGLNPAERVTNGTFTNNLNSWSPQPTTNSWQWNSGLAQTNQQTPNSTIELMQCLTPCNPTNLSQQWITSGISYTFSVTAFVPANTHLRIFFRNPVTTHQGDPNYPKYFDSDAGIDVDRSSLSGIGPTTFTGTLFLPNPINGASWDKYYYYQIVVQSEADGDYSSSNDDNLTIDNVSITTDALGILNISIPTSNDLFALTQQLGGPLYIFHSMNDGMTWTNDIVQSPGFNCSTSCNSHGAGFPEKFEFEVSPNDIQRMYFGGNVLYRSTNSGLNFSCVTCYNGNYFGPFGHADVRAIKLLKIPQIASDYLWLGTDGGIMKSTSSGDGSSWQNLNGEGLQLTEFYGFDANDLDIDNIVGGAMHNGISAKKIYSGNTVAEWRQISDGDAYDCVFKNGSGVGYAESTMGGPSIYPFTNEGETIGSITQPSSVINAPNGNPLITRYDPNSSDPSDQILFAAYNHIVYTPTNNISSSSWTLQKMTDNNGNQVDAGFGQIVAMDIDKNDIEKKYVVVGETNTAGNLKVFKWHFDIQTGTSHWFDKTANLPVASQPATSIAVDPYNNNRAWVGLGGFVGTVPNPDPSRVWYCADASAANNTWVNMSDGLPDLPVNCLTYWEGSDDVIFAGTDVGVYVWNKYANNGQGSWECFSENLPKCIIIKLEINYCAGKLRAGTHGRGIWETDLPPLPYKGAYHFTVNTTWDKSMVMSNNYVVDAGKTLTINNEATISMASNTYIKVMPGAKLIIDNATLTNSCGYMWSGIQVIGDPTQDQTIDASDMPVHQGMLVMKNNATIENAYVGAMADAVAELNDAVAGKGYAVAELLNTLTELHCAAAESVYAVAELDCAVAEPVYAVPEKGCAAAEPVKTQAGGDVAVREWGFAVDGW